MSGGLGDAKVHPTEMSTRYSKGSTRDLCTKDSVGIVVNLFKRCDCDTWSAGRRWLDDGNERRLL